MYVTKEEKKKFSIVKLVVIIASIAAIAATFFAAFMFWKKKFGKAKELENQIDAAIDAAFAEEEDVETIELDVVEVDA